MTRNAIGSFLVGLGLLAVTAGPAADVFTAHLLAQSTPARLTVAESAQIRRDAEAGSAIAQLKLGQLFERGETVFQDFAEALAWFHKAASQGLPEAELAVGMAYATGRGVWQDDAAAFQWFRRAAAQGLAKAEFMTGLAFVAGKGVEQDNTKATEWLGKAAAQGHPPAQFWFGLRFHIFGKAPSDHFAASESYRKAAVQGYPQAQYLLGQLLVGVGSDRMVADSSRGLVRDDIEAMKWFSICSAHIADEEEIQLNSWFDTGLYTYASPSSCAAAHADVAKRMSHAEISDAETQALHWIDGFQRSRQR